MKKGVLFLLSALSFGSILTTFSLTSCDSQVSVGTSFTLDYVKEIVDVKVTNAKKSYKEGDIVKLEFTIKEGYEVTYVTINGVKSESNNEIKLERGHNIIKVYCIKTTTSEGSTNLRDFDFVINTDKKSYSIYGYNPSGILPKTLNIPATYNDLPVTGLAYIIDTNSGAAISRYVFGGIKTINFPASVISIDPRCFVNNTTTTAYTVDPENKDYQSIDGNLYDKNGKVLIAFAQESTKELTLPETVTEIGDFAFFGSLKLEKINFNSKLTKIGNSAFYGCTSLKEVVLPNSVTEIGISAFQGCNGLENVTLSNSLTSIKEATFRQCNKLTSINIPGSVKKIEQYAFFDDKGLANVTFNEGLEELSINSFSYVGLKEANLPTSLKVIGDNAFLQCSNLKVITLKEGLQTIGSNAFLGTPIETITLPASLTKIGTEVFSRCLQLKEFKVSENSTILKAVDGVLFTKDLKKLIAYPNLKEVKTYEIPKTTEILAFRCFGYVSVHPFEQSMTPYSLETVIIPTSITIMENPFYAANLSKVIYEGTKEEFEAINTKCEYDGEQYDWDTGSNDLKNKIEYKGEKA